MVNEKGKEKFFSTWALLIHKFLSVSVAMLSENHIHDDNGRIFGYVMSDKGKTIILYNNERCSLLFTHPDESPQKRGSEQYINYLWRFSLGSKAIVALLNCPFVSRALGRKEVQQTFLCSLFLLFAVSEICVRFVGARREGPYKRSCDNKCVAKTDTFRLKLWVFNGGWCWRRLRGHKEILKMFL